MLLPPKGYSQPQIIKLDGKDPKYFCKCDQFRITMKLLEDLEKNGPAAKFYDAQLIPEALENPAGIFEGLGRHGLSLGLCYSYTPSER